MEMDTYVDKSEMSMDYDYVHDVEVRTDALQNRPGEDSEVQAAARGVKLYRLVAVTFGLLCILQAAVNISLRFVHFSDTEARYKNLSEERYGLERRLDTLDTESRCKILRDEEEALERRMSTTGWQCFGDSLYYISLTKKSWNESRSDCVEKGAHLMIINSKEEQEFTRQLTKDVWIGLTDAEKEGTWKWVDGTPLTTSYWSEGEPNNIGLGNKGEDCGEVSVYTNEIKWNDRGCEVLNYWICEKTVAP